MSSATVVLSAWLGTIAAPSVQAASAEPRNALEALGPVPVLTDHGVGDPRALAAPTADAAQEVPFPVVNTASRETARLFYRTVYAASAGPSPLWTGNLETCDPGTTDRAYRDLVALRINYFRAMAGAPAGLAVDDGYSAKAQAAALMMSRNLRLDHFPTEDWACYSAVGAEAAANSVLAIGRVGPRAIDSYIEDYGEVNAAVGHRRWLLYPQTRWIGSGDIPGGAMQSPANATWVFDGNYGTPRPTTREEFVAWPPPGYVPFPFGFPRWSFSLDDADFSSATVTLASNGVQVAIEVEPLSDGSGENSLVWHVAGQDTTLPSSPPRPPADTVYGVTIQNVLLNGQPRSFNYEVVLFDPDQPGPDTVLPVVTGARQTAAGVPYHYEFTAVPVASGHQRLRGRREGLSMIEGAEAGLGSFVASTSPGYDPVVTGVKASGNRSFHLAHAAPNTDQTLTSQRVLLPSASAELRFKEYLGAATPSQIGRVEISLDDGLSWTPVYSRAGSNGGGLIIFQTTTVPLGSFAGRVLRLRFNYHHDGGTYYPQTDLGVGWYLDDISLANTDELKEVVVTDLADTTSFAFAAPVPGNYVLAVRGQFLDRYPLDWGPLLGISAVAGGTPPVVIVGKPVLTGDKVQVDFQVTGEAAGASYLLLSAPATTGPWTVENGASFSAVQPGTVFRVSAPQLGRAQAFFRLRSQ